MMTESCNNKLEVPLWHKYSLSVEEAAVYFRVGENKLRSLIQANPKESFILWNGNRAQIKRRLFEDYLDCAVSI